jgi:quinol monooxygenase YgiN
MKKFEVVVIAEFNVSPTYRDAFLELCRFDAERSVADEPGCSQFDVSTSNENAESVVLYEVYNDQAAFDHHLTTPHYQTFADGVQRLGVQIALVRFFTRQHP